MDGLIEEAQPPNFDPPDQNQLPVETSENVTLPEIEVVPAGECPTSTPPILVPLPLLDPKPKEIKLTCPLCNETCQTGRELSLHLDAHPKQTCKVCLLKFRNPDAFNRHSNSHKKPKPPDFIVHQFKCDYTSCEKTYKYKSNLQRHKYFHKNNTLLQRILTCENCEVRFSYEDQYNFHLENQSSDDGNCLSEPEIKCEICQKVFSAVVNFRKHKLASYATCKALQNQNAVKSISKIKIISDQSQTEPNSKSLMSTTNASITSDIPANLKTHSKTKSKLIHRCVPCNRIFTTERHFKTHLQVSLAHRPGLNDMTNARKINENNKSNPSVPFFQCPKCSIKFEDQIDYNDHLHQHRSQQKTPENKTDNGEVSKCRFCAQVFDCKFSAFKHETKVHPFLYHHRKYRLKYKTTRPVTIQTTVVDGSNKLKKRRMYPETKLKALQGVRITAVQDQTKKSAKLLSCYHTCVPCNKSFTYKSQLKSHYSSYAHFQTTNYFAGYRCDICKKKFITKTDLKNHVRYDCQENLDGISGQNNTIEVNVEATTRTDINGERQRPIFSNDESESVSSPNESPEVFSCIPCNITFPYKHLLDGHLLCYAHSQVMKAKAHAAIAYYRCGICEKFFSAKEMLITHLITKHNVDKSHFYTLNSRILNDYIVRVRAKTEDEKPYDDLYISTSTSNVCQENEPEPQPPKIVPELDYEDEGQPEVRVSKPSNLNVYLPSKGLIKLPCPHCDKFFFKKWKLRLHIIHAHNNTEKEVNPIAIPKQPNIVESLQEKLHNTVLVVNRDEVEPGNKYLLDMTAALVDKMNDTIKVKDDEKNMIFFCFPCNKTLTSIHYLRDHNFRYHQKVGNETFVRKEKNKIKESEQVFHVEMPMNIKFDEEEAEIARISTENSKRKLEVVEDTQESNLTKKIKTKVTEDFQEPERETQIIAESNTTLSKVSFSCEPCKKSFTHKYLLDGHLLSYAHKMMLGSDVIFHRCRVCNTMFSLTTFVSSNIHRHLKSKNHIKNSRLNPSVKSEDVIVPVRKSDVLGSISMPKTHVPSQTSSSSDDEDKEDEDPVIMNHVFPEPEVVEIISSDEGEYEVKPETIEISQSKSTPEIKTIEVKIETIEVPEPEEVVNSCHLGYVDPNVIKVEPYEISEIKSGEMQMDLKHEEEEVEISSDEDEVKPEISQSTPEIKTIEIKTEIMDSPEIIEPICSFEIEDKVNEIKSETVEDIQVTVKSEPKIVEANVLDEFQVPKIVNSFPLASIDPDVEIKPKTIVELTSTDVPKINENPICFPCTKCSKTFQKDWELENHLAIHLRLERLENPTKSLDYVPIKYGKATVHSTAKSSHKRKSKKKKTEKQLHFCPICVHTFNKSYHLNKHYREKHPDARVPIPRKIDKPKKPNVQKNKETELVKVNKKLIEAIEPEAVENGNDGNIPKRDINKTVKLKKPETNKNQVKDNETKQVKVNKNQFKSMVENGNSGSVPKRDRPKKIKVDDAKLPKVNPNKKQLVSSRPEMKRGNVGNVPKRGRGRPKKIKVDDTKLPGVSLNKINNQVDEEPDVKVKTEVVYGESLEFEDVEDLQSIVGLEV